MKPSILVTTNPPTPLFTPFRTNLHLQRHRYKISTVRCTSNPPTSLSISTPTLKPSDVFGDKKELTAIQSLVESLSPSVRVAGSALIFAAAVAAGYGLGSRFGGSHNVRLGGAVVAGAAGAGVAYALNSCVPEVAAASLWN